MWAVAKTGAAFLPIDPNYPPDRIEHMVTDSRASVGVTVLNEGANLPATIDWLLLDDIATIRRTMTVSDEPLTDSDRAPIHLDQTAYVIYTSGSTGKPKGVVVSHRGLANFTAEQRERYSVDAESRVLHVASPSFDAMMLEFLMAVGAGATLIVSPPDVYAGHYLQQLIDDRRVSHAFITPGVLSTLDPFATPTLRTLVAGGEAVPAELVQRWAPGRNLHNGYGPTETIIMVAISHAMDPNEPVTIGGPIRGVEAVVLDAWLRPVPLGIAGELYIGGAQLARGYHDRPELTADRFVANPFGKPGARLYRTGDVVRWIMASSGDLELEYLGRTDFQVKIRGLRIELGEIDAVLSAGNDLEYAATLGLRGPAGSTVLVSYVVPASGAAVDPDQLRERVAAAVPGYMVPSGVIVLDAVPLTPVGKLDRSALPMPDFSAGRSPFLAPRTPAEESVAAVFGEVLNLDRVSINESFFDLGGNSLLATRIVARINATLESTVSLRDLFDAPTVAQLAARLRPASDRRDRTQLVARTRPERIPLSAAQQRMWVLNQLDTDSPAYNVAIALRLTGNLDVAALNTAIGDVIGRHESLRTMYPSDALGPVQVILAPAAATPELTAVTVAARDVFEHVAALVGTGFDVTAGAPLRLGLLRLAPDIHVVVVVVHHISTDGVSMAPLGADLIAAYAARAEGLTPQWEQLPVQYADFTLWQSDVLGDENDDESLAARQVRFWSETLADLPERLELPTDRPRPAVQTMRGASIEFSIDAATHRNAMEFAQQRNTSLFMIVHTALAVVLGRLSGTSDITVGTPVAGRSEQALDNVVGMFVNTLALRTVIDEQATIADLLSNVRNVDLDAFANADIPFERIVVALDPTRSASHHPIFQVMLSFENFAIPVVELPGLTVRLEDLRRETEQFDLSLVLRENAGGLTGSLSYATDLFDAATARAFTERFASVLAQVCTQPDRRVGALTVLSNTEREALVPARGRDGLPARTWPDLLTSAVACHADDPALIAGTETLTYRELDERSNRLARVLIRAGARPESMVAVALPRSVESVVTMWAVAKTGAVFVPVDPNHPAERIAHILGDSGALIGVTAAGWREPIPETLEWVVLDDPAVQSTCAAAEATPITDDDRRSPLRIEHCAYIIYTSGSTGLPKGVCVSHRGLASLVASSAAARAAALPPFRITHLSSPVFDVSVEELLVGFAAGATSVIVPTSAYAGPELAEVLVGQHVTHLDVTPGVLATLDPDDVADLRSVVVGGDVCPPDLVAKWSDRVRMVNAYGPTETTISATYSAPLSLHDSISIGSPADGVSALVLDRALRPVPVGVTGELYLGGDGLARGYHRRAGLTADRFVADPTGNGDRMYRTGDLVRWNPDHTLHYVGRSDFQVKIRGQRIELGEIDSALLAHRTVGQVTTIGHTSAAGKTSLVAYAVAAENESPDSAELTEWLRDRLPSYMIPASIMIIEAIPLTPIGKLDRSALPEPVFAVESEYRSPRTPLETALAALFAEVLGRERVGIDDSFFALGGDSIMAIQLMSRAKAQGLRFSALQIFEHRTVAELATVTDTAVVVSLEELEGGGVGSMPMTPVVRFMVDEGGGFDRFVQSVTLALPVGISRPDLVATLTVVIDHHDMLRSSLRLEDGQWQLAAGPAGSVVVDDVVHRVEFDAKIGAQELHDLAEAELDSVMDRLSPANGNVLQCVWLDPATPDRGGILVVAAHHLAVDGVTWRILVPDLLSAWGQLSSGATPVLPEPTTSMRRWAHALADEAHKPDRVAELSLWRSIIDGPDPLVGGRDLDPAVDLASTVQTVTVEVSAEITDALLTRLPAAFHGGVNDGLLTALTLALLTWRGRRGVTEASALIRLEGHGREDAVLPGADTSRTAGWFTTLFPIRLDLRDIDTDEAWSGGSAMNNAIKAVKEQLRAVPDKGIGYGLLRCLNEETAPQLPHRLPGQISFNYLGRVGAAEMPEGLAGLGWLPTDELGDLALRMNHDMPAAAVIDVNAMVKGDRLSAHFSYPETLLDRGDVDEFADLWLAALAQVARHAQSSTAGGHTPSDFTLVDVAQRDIEVWEARYPSLDDVWPLSPLQAGLLFHGMLADSSVDAYVVQLVLTLFGDVDSARLRVAAQAMTSRYPNLHAAFVVDSSGQSVQVVGRNSAVPWAELDLRDVAGADRDARFADIAAADHTAGFDFAAPPLIRFTLVRVGETAWKLIVTNHHILMDGWSMPLLMRDLLVLYATRGDTSALPPVASYKTYLAWLADWDATTSVQAWRDALAGIDEPTLLAAPNPERRNSGTGRIEFGLNEEQTVAATEVAARLGITMNTLVQCAWGIVLGHALGRDDVVFGATVSGRPPQLAGVESMVGLFINTIPVRMRFEPSHTVAALLRQAQHDQAKLLDHHYLGLPAIHSAVGSGAQFDTLVVYESYPVDAEGLRQQAADIDGMSVGGIEGGDTTHYPMTLVLHKDNCLEGIATYALDLFDEVFAEAMVDRLVRVLAAVVDDPEGSVGDIELITKAERTELVTRVGANGSPPGLLSDLITRAVERNPEGIAITFEGASTSYRAFDEASNQLARVLIQRGVGPEDAVALAIPRSTESVVALAAVAKSGAAFVPVDPKYPSERVADMIADCGATVGFTLTSLRPELPDSVSWIALDDPSCVAAATLCSAARVTDADRIRPLRPAHPSYVVYTSGSTGVPKGVVVTHAGLPNFSAEQRERYTVTTESRILHFASPSFDGSVLEFLMAIGAGATLVVAPPTIYGGADLSAFIAQEHVTHAFITTAALSSMDPTGLDSLRVVCTGGEACPPDLAARWAGTDAAGSRNFYNAYGPTETTIITMISNPLTAQSLLTIGGPIRGTQALVLDRQLRPVPPGVPGELYISGVQLARGYRARPELNAARFVANPFAVGIGDRMYRTGDIVRWTARGELEFIGRADFQVKLRGFRIELGEIEAVLAALPTVGQTTVMVRSDSVAGDQLVGYLVPATPECVIDTAAVRAAVAEKLPAHMVPAALVVLNSLPLNINGKVDRKALPAPDSGTREYRAPSTPLERTIADAFADTLGVEQVGLDDSFFELGGNSLLAMAVIGRLRNALDTPIPVVWIFDEPTTAALSRRIAASDGSESDADSGGLGMQVLLPIRLGGDREPLVCIHPASGIAWCYQGLAETVDPGRPIYGLQSPDLSGDDSPPASVIEFADRYVREIRSIQPHGPYHLLGWSFGGVIAHEIAVRLREFGEEVGLLAMLDSDWGLYDDVDYPPMSAGDFVHTFGPSFGIDFVPPQLSASEVARLIADRFGLDDQLLSAATLQRITDAYNRTAQTRRGHHRSLFDGDLVYFAATLGEQVPEYGAAGWQPFIGGEIVDYGIAATHDDLTSPDVLPTIASVLNDVLNSRTRAVAQS
ncbi:non-ribosomal peptide synthetase [Antrihabitans stalactiti]|uniref:Amino acid adenylation domain-containing protein n=1 Tax=Antrihabitans stalactiti TaxID=2584121 RepID=A0A848KJT7_9NOCA|nr:amino acid adenylation domain-containing protein [Antrihabitans stalactiti]